MRRAVVASGVAVVAATVGVLGSSAARGDDGGEPVELQVTAPAVARAHVRFKVAVRVTADLGAFDIAAKPVRMRVKLAKGECGGSFDGTDGTPVLDQVLTPQPTSGAGYAATATGNARIGSYGVRTVCAYVEDDEQRQFATADDTTIDVSKPCSVASKSLATTRTALKRARKRHDAARVKTLTRRAASQRKRAIRACRAPAS